jgi:phage tail-like protein
MGRTFANDPLQKFKFTVSMPGVPSGMGFQKLSGLDRETNIVTYDEGGYKYQRKLPGKPKVNDIVLEKGMFADAFMEDLYKASLSSSGSRKTVIVNQQDIYGKVARTWTLAEAWVSKWESSEFDSTSDGVAIEKITVTFEYLVD